MHLNGIGVSSQASAGSEGSVGKGLFSPLSPYKSWPRSQTAAFLPGSTFLAGQQGENNHAAHATPSLNTCQKNPEQSRVQDLEGQPACHPDVILQCWPT